MFGFGSNNNTNKSAMDSYSDLVVLTAKTTMFMHAIANTLQQAGKPNLSMKHRLHASILEEDGEQLYNNRNVAEVIFCGRVVNRSQAPSTFREYMGYNPPDSLNFQNVLDMYEYSSNLLSKLFNRAVITTAKALNENQRWIVNAMTESPDCLKDFASTMVFLTEDYKDASSFHTELRFVPDSLSSLDIKEAPISDYADIDGEITSYMPREFISVYFNSSSGMYHGQTFSIPGFQSPGHLYQCGSQESIDALGEAINHWRNNIDLS